MAEPRRYVCAACNDVSVVREEPPEDRCMLCDHDEWRDDGKSNWPSDQGAARIAKLEAALRRIAEASPLIGGEAYAMRNIAREALSEKI